MKAMQRSDSDPQSWPELKGKTFEEAAEVIKRDRLDVQVFKVPENSMVTMDFRPDRVRIFVNDQDIVVQPPRTG